METTPIAVSQIARDNYLNPKTLEKQYKEKLSNFHEWLTENNPEALVYPENFGSRMSIDEVALHQGELYTVITNKDAKGRKGALAALIKGTKNAIVSKALEKVPISKKMAVKEITADLAENMDWICRTNFHNSIITADRFHVQKVVTEVVQEIRIKFRREAIDKENMLIVEAKKERRKYIPERLANGDTEKQLLARSRYLLFKPPTKWTASQIERAKLLFEKYPELKQAYYLSQHFRKIFETKIKADAGRLIRKWFEKVNKSEIKPLMSAACTIENNLPKILNYFENRETNASAESFNAKLKTFRSLVRGVRDVDFFLFRIEKLFG